MEERQSYSDQYAAVNIQKEKNQGKGHTQRCPAQPFPPDASDASRSNLLWVNISTG